MIQTTEVSITYKGDGVQTSFPYSYPYRNSDDIVGYIINDVGYEKRITNNFKYDKVSNIYQYPLAGEPLAAPYSIKLIRETPQQQNADLPGKLPFSLIEKSLDWIIMILQEIGSRCNSLWHIRNDCKLSETNARNSASAAAESEENAANSEDMAKKWAMSPVSPDGVVDTNSPTGYTQSAKVWAEEAKGYRDIAIAGQMQSDWNEEDTESKAFVKNKPDITGMISSFVKSYDSVEEMKDDLSIKKGMTLQTLGYHTPNDSGASLYTVREKNYDDDVEDSGLLHFLKNGLVAQLIVTNNFIRPEQFGAYGDNEHDDSVALQKALDTNKYILADKTYKISKTIVISPNRQQLTYMLIGNFYYTGTDTAFKIVNCPNGSYVRFGKVVAKNGDVLTLNGSDSYGLGAITYLHLLFQEFYAGDENCCIKILSDNMWVNENTFENGRCSHGKYAVYAQNETEVHHCEHNKFTNCIFEVTTYGAYLKGVSSFSFINLRHGENTHLLTTEGSCLYLQIILAELIIFSRDEIHLSPDTNGYIVSQFASKNFDYSEGHCIAKITRGHILIENQDVYQNPHNKGSINISDTYSASRDTPTVMNVSEMINTVILGDKYGDKKITEIVLSLNSLTTRSVTVKSDENTVIHTFDSTTPDGSYVRLKFIPVYGWFYEILQKA